MLCRFGITITHVKAQNYRKQIYFSLLLYINLCALNSYFLTLLENNNSEMYTYLYSELWPSLNPFNEGLRNMFFKDPKL